MQAKKLYLRSFGCQMNDYDSGRIADLLNAEMGYERTDVLEEADLVVVNTCSIREKAALTWSSDRRPCIVCPTCFAPALRRAVPRST